MSSKVRVNSAVRKYWKLLVLLFVVLGFSTMLPVNVGRPNFFGYFTLCSFAPIATLAMFILALVIYSFVNKRELLLYGNLFLLLVIVAFTVFWVYDAKIPIEGVSVNMAIYYHYFENQQTYYGNVSKIFFNIVFHNTAMWDTPSFRIEYYDFYVEGRKLEYYTYDVSGSGGTSWWSAGRGRETRWIGSYVTLRPNQTMILEGEVTINFDHTKVEGGTIDDIWVPLSNNNFSFRMDGILVSRNYYGSEEEEGVVYDIVWASKPFSTSYAYQE